MSQDDEPGATLHLLVADTTGRAVMVTRPGGAPGPLPSTDAVASLEDFGPIETAVGAILGHDPAILRVVPTYPSGPIRSREVVVEAEPPPGDRLPEGLAWLPLGDATAATLGPAIIQATLERWLGERRSGVPAALRPRWSRAGFLEEARAYVTERMAEAGSPVQGTPRISYLWGLSAVVRAETGGGAVFLKSCARVFATEPSITAAVSSVASDLVPAVLAADDAEGWLLTRDVGGTPIGDGPADLWADGLVALGNVQRRWRTSPKAVQLERRGPAELAASLPNLIEDPLLDGLPEALRVQLRQALPELLAACARIGRLGPGPTLVHGDFHPWNVHRADERIAIIDWSDSCLGHPFFDLTTYLGRAADPEVRRAIVARYLDGWTGEGARADLEEAAILALPLGALHQVESYRRIVASLEPDDAWNMVLAGRAYARAALSWLKAGLAAESWDHVETAGDVDDAAAAAGSPSASAPVTM